MALAMVKESRSKVTPKPAQPTPKAATTFSLKQVGRGLQHRNFAQKSEKKVLPSGYNPALVGPVAKIPTLEVLPNETLSQVMPVAMRARPEDFWIDHNYQRELTQSDIAFIKHTAEHWNWAYYKAPNVMFTPDGRLFAVDGQATIVSALYHPEIKEIPFLGYEMSAEEFIAFQAKSFIGLNTLKRGVPRADLLTAAIIANDPTAVKLQKFFQKHGLNVLRTARADKKYGARETMCAQTLKNILISEGDELFDKLCTVLAGANLAPIRSIHAYAVSQLIRINHVRGSDIEPKRLINAIRSIVPKHAYLEAVENMRRAKKHTTMTKALADVWQKRYDEHRPAIS